MSISWRLEGTCLLVYFDATCTYLGIGKEVKVGTFHR